MKKSNAFVVLLVLIPIILVTQCKSKEYAPDYKTTTPILITDIEGNNEDPFLLRAKDGTLYLVWFSERSGNADIYMRPPKTAEHGTSILSSSKVAEQATFIPHWHRQKTAGFT
jgi:hypothetical protein